SGTLQRNHAKRRYGGLLIYINPIARESVQDPDAVRQFLRIEFPYRIGGIDTGVNVVSAAGSNADCHRRAPASASPRNGRRRELYRHIHSGEAIDGLRAIRLVWQEFSNRKR